MTISDTTELITEMERRRKVYKEQAKSCRDKPQAEFFMGKAAACLDLVYELKRLKK